MPVAMLLEVPGGTQEDYDRVMDELQLEGMPDGGILHIAAPMEGGWRVLDVWETQEHFERFYEDRLAAAIEKSGMAQANPPKFQEVHGLISSEHAPVAAA
jgi:hypothetical protein